MDKRRCDNLACVCEVDPTVGTCSDYCASPAGRDTNNIRCECGHPACAAEMDRELTGRMATR
jgi:hypothetical protein